MLLCRQFTVAVSDDRINMIYNQLKEEDLADEEN